jgi:hypothetical protein
VYSQQRILRLMRLNGEFGSILPILQIFRLKSRLVFSSCFAFRGPSIDGVEGWAFSGGIDDLIGYYRA